MATNEVTNQVLAVLDTFGMTGVKAAEVMGISQSLFKHKKLGLNHNRFNENDYNALVKYIKEKAAEL